MSGSPKVQIKVKLVPTGLRSAFKPGLTKIPIRFNKGQNRGRNGSKLILINGSIMLVVYHSINAKQRSSGPKLLDILYFFVD